MAWNAGDRCVNIRCGDRIATVDVACEPADGLPTDPDDPAAYHCPYLSGSLSVGDETCEYCGDYVGIIGDEDEDGNDIEGEIDDDDWYDEDDTAGTAAERLAELWGWPSDAETDVKFFLLHALALGWPHVRDEYRDMWHIRRYKELNPNQ
jgi:hypothetical protein